MLFTDLARKATSLREVRQLRLEPNHVRIRGEHEFTLDRGLDATGVVVVSLACLGAYRNENLDTTGDSRGEREY